MITTPEQMREAAAHDNDLIRRGDALAVCGQFNSLTHGILSDAIRAIPIAPQPVAVTVKPLVWEDPCNGNSWLHVARSVFGDYYVSIDGGRHSAWLEANLRPYENKIGDDVGSVWEAKALADADYDARTRALVQPADPLSDQRVVALVTPQIAAQLLLDTMRTNPPLWDAMVDAAETIYETGVSFNRVVGTALRAIGGEA